MNNMSYQWSHYEAHITGFLPTNSVIQGPKGITRSVSPSIELTIVFPHDDPRVVRVRYPIEGSALRKCLCGAGAILMGNEVRRFNVFLRAFAQHVVENLGWYRPHSFPFEGPRYTRRNASVVEVSEQ
jgi:hypothetical protein